MKVVMLYHPESEHARSVLVFQRDFEEFASKKVELLSLETPEGDDMAKLYGITQYPAIVVCSDNGELQKLWEGESLPLISEVVSYTL
jgi:hypothetical protein